MNLLPNEDKDVLKNGLKQRFVIVANILLTTSFLIGIVMLLPSYFLIRIHLGQIDALNYPVKTENEESTKDILDLPKEIDSKLKFLEANIENKRIVDSLSKLILSVPEKVKLNSISLTRNQGEKEKKGVAIVVSGVAGDRESLVLFGTILKESKFFSAVEVPVSSLTKEKNLPFSMNVFIEEQK